MKPIEAVEVTTKFKDIKSAEFYEEMVEKALTVREEADKLSWRLGEIALNITDRFGTKALKDFARDAKVKYSTLRRYRDITKQFPNWRELTETFKSLSWTHFRLTAAQPEKIKLLERACDENWSCEKTEQMTREKENIIDDGEHVPPRPELVFDRGLRLWYIGSKEDDARYLRNLYKKERKEKS